jgi:hypothetical protein
MHRSEHPLTLAIELDKKGKNEWQTWKEVQLSEQGHAWIDLRNAPDASWIRIRTLDAAKQLTAWFTFSSVDQRLVHSDLMQAFAPIDAVGNDAVAADSSQRRSIPTITGGSIRARGGNKRTLHFAAERISSDGKTSIGLYELDGTMTLRPDTDTAALDYHRKHAAIPVGVLMADEASVIYVDDSGKRWRLPRAQAELSLNGINSATRVCREVATERDLFNAAGTFYELPAENAGGFSKVRAVATHGRHIVDYCSYRGLLVMSGVLADPSVKDQHIIHSSDNQTALWVGAVDDVWQFGKPRGLGGPWAETVVKANQPSDPYLLSGFDLKTVKLAHNASSNVNIKLECDITGNGLWIPFREVEVMPKMVVSLEIPPTYSAYWLRAISDTECQATCQLEYK